MSVVEPFTDPVWCVMCKYGDERSEVDVTFHAIEDTELAICDPCLESIKEWKIKRSIWLLVDDAVMETRGDEIAEMFDEMTRRLDM
jgi:hypothetical protein